MGKKCAARKAKWGNLRQSQKLVQWKMTFAQKFKGFRSYKECNSQNSLK